MTTNAYAGRGFYPVCPPNTDVTISAIYKCHWGRAAGGREASGAARQSCDRLPVLIDILLCRTRLKSSSLPTTAPDASISAISTSQARPPSLIGRPSAKIPNRPNSTIAGEVAEANYGRLKSIFSQKITDFRSRHRPSPLRRSR